VQKAISILLDDEQFTRVFNYVLEPNLSAIRQKIRETCALYGLTKVVSESTIQSMTIHQLLEVEKKIYPVKVEKPLKRHIVDVSAIRVYLPEFLKEVNMTIERNECPKLLVKRTRRAKTKADEVEIVFLGTEKERHVEDFGYFLKPPSNWKTWGEIVLTPKYAARFIEALQDCIADSS